MKSKNERTITEGNSGCDAKRIAGQFYQRHNDRRRM